MPVSVRILDRTGLDARHCIIQFLAHGSDTAIANLNTVVADIKDANLKATVAKVDDAVDNINNVVAQVKSPILQHIDATIVSADSLLTDIKAHPKRYVHFSVF